jgi:phosphosulfolactate synthase (CoM biosynthesis protein A)
MATNFALEDLFDKGIFELLGIADASQSRKDVITESIIETVENRVLARILDGLDDNSSQLFQEAAEKGGDAVSVFLEGHNVDLASITAEEVLYYKAQLTQVVTGAVLQQA